MIDNEHVDGDGCGKSGKIRSTFCDGDIRANLLFSFAPQSMDQQDLLRKISVIPLITEKTVL